MMVSAALRWLLGALLNDNRLHWMVMLLLHLEQLLPNLRVLLEDGDSNLRIDELDLGLETVRQ